MTFPIEASCQCGQVSYVLKSAPLKVFACHCSECQKLSTSPFSVTAMVDANDIEFSGELGEWRRKADSGNINGAKFCTGCGNRIYHFSPSDMSIIKLKLKPIAADTAYLFEPQVHVWVSEKQSWYEIPKGVKAFDKQP